MKDSMRDDCRIDDVLSETDKIALYKRVQDEDFVRTLKKECGLCESEAQERMVSLYAKIMQKPVGFFWKGVPTCEGQWVRFFQAMVKFEIYHVSHERKRLPILVLDKVLRVDSDQHVTTKLDLMSESAWGEAADRIEAHDLWECARKMVDAECAEQGFGEKAANAARMNLLEEAKPKECAEALKSTSNAVSQNLFRIRQGIAKSERMRRFKAELKAGR